MTIQDGREDDDAGNLQAEYRVSQRLRRGAGARIGEAVGSTRGIQLCRHDTAYGI
jgi:hypothetical protein